MIPIAQSCSKSLSKRISFVRNPSLKTTLRDGISNSTLSFSNIRFLKNGRKNYSTSHIPIEKLIKQKKTYTFSFPEYVQIIEVGPRDGLQNEKKIVSTQDKIEFIHRLQDSGVTVVETTSFVSPKAVPQMADHNEVFKGITKKEGVSYPVLTPNMKGLQSALEIGVKRVAVFVGATDEFCKANINMNTVDDALAKYEEVVKAARKENLEVRGYVSCVCGCPYKGYVDPKEVAYAAQALYQMGCYEISLGDTIGVGTPGSTEKMLMEVLKYIPDKNIAAHFHNTYGQALGNILRSLQIGISAVDSSVAGIGGCPFARNATGNVPSEDVVYMLQGMDIDTGINLESLIRTGEWICKLIDRRNNSNVSLAYLSQPGTPEIPRLRPKKDGEDDEL